jgi:hypothetical protein
MTIRYHADLMQGDDAWLAARCGILTASEMKLALTPTLKIADNDKIRSHVYELAAQRITRYVEPHYIGDDMLRGMTDEIDARAIYAQHNAPVQEVGFITNDEWGFVLGYSPDGLVGDSGLIECKSRRQKFQVETICKMEIPGDYVLQVQTGLLVSRREWLDFVSFSAGLPMVVIRAFPDAVIQDAILNAAHSCEKKIADAIARYDQISVGLIKTERKVEQEISV